MNFLQFAMPIDSLTIKDAIKLFGLEYLRGKPILDGSTVVFINNDSLDRDIELWADEPHNQHLSKRFYGGDSPDAEMVRWIYSSQKLMSWRDTPFHLNRVVWNGYPVELLGVFRTQTEAVQAAQASGFEPKELRVTQVTFPAPDVQCRLRLDEQEEFWTEGNAEASYSLAGAFQAIKGFMSEMQDHGLKLGLKDIQVSFNGEATRPAWDYFPMLARKA